MDIENIQNMCIELITTYCEDNDLTIKEYAAKVGLPQHVIKAIQLRLLAFDDLQFGSIVKILNFHGYHLQCMIE